MTDFWDKVSDGLHKGIDAVVDTTGSLVNKGKEALDEGQIKFEREKKFRELGEMLYNMMMKDDLEIAALQDKCEEISQLSSEKKQGE